MWLFISFLAYAVPLHPPLLAESVQEVSRYPLGRMPENETTRNAISCIAREGGVSELSLLQNILRNEKAVVSQQAFAAVQEILARHGMTNTSSTVFAQSD